jgi:hypothetical protein
MSAGTTVINKEYLEVVYAMGPLPTVYDLNYEVVTSTVYHTQVFDVNVEYIGDMPFHTRTYDVNLEYLGNTPYHTQISDIVVEVIAAAPELSPQPVLPYFSLYFQT